MIMIMNCHINELSINMAHPSRIATRDERNK